MFDLGPEALYRGTGLRIYTTLDPRLQALAEESVREGVAALADRNATNGALVAIAPDTGHILAMVGSVDFYDEEIAGQGNVALRCRQPYVPTNYDEKFHGPMLLRDALANSYNIPAVDTLRFVGVDNLLELGTRLGVESLVHPELYCPDYPYEQPPHYGLALTLGGGETKLLEMAGAFAVFANDGERILPSPILRIEDSRGFPLSQHSRTRPAGGGQDRHHQRFPRCFDDRLHPRPGDGRLGGQLG